jgi:hypothetical protein
MYEKDEDLRNHMLKSYLNKSLMDSAIYTLSVSYIEI